MAKKARSNAFSGAIFTLIVGVVGTSVRLSGVFVGEDCSLSIYSCSARVREHQPYSMLEFGLDA